MKKTTKHSEDRAIDQMDRAQPSWTRASLAPLVLRDWPIDEEYFKYGIEADNIANSLFSEIEGIEYRDCQISDTTVAVNFATPNSGGKVRTASEHPLRFRKSFSDDFLNPIPSSAREAFFSAVDDVWDALVSDFRWLAREGKLQIVARTKSPLGPFTEIAPDAFEHFEISDWFHGVAQAPGGEHLYSIHAYRPTAASQPLPLQPERVRRRAQPAVDRAKMLIDREFPNGVPGKSDLSDKLLVSRITKSSSDSYAARGERPHAPPGRDSILRASGRRPSKLSK
jgi:hypothetical protein